MPRWPRRQAPFIVAICLLLSIALLIVGTLRIGHPRGVPAFYFVGAVLLVTFTAAGVFSAYGNDLPEWWARDPALVRSAAYAVVAALLGLALGGIWIAGGVQKDRPGSVALGSVVAAAGLVWLPVLWKGHRSKTTRRMVLLNKLRFPCPCCRYLTLSHPANGSYDLCPVCWWEDDPVQLDDPTRSGGANNPSLEEARRNFGRFGAIEERFVANVRRTTTDEIPPS